MADFLELLARGQVELVRNELVNVLETAAIVLLKPASQRRCVVVITNVSANQLDLSWGNANLAAGAGEYQLQQRDTYIEYFDTRAGGIGEPIWGTLHAIKSTAAGNVRVLEYEVYQ